MPIIFPFTQTGTVIATVVFFVCLIVCGLIGVYLDTEKSERHLGWRITLIVLAFICLYSEYSAVNIGITLNPEKKANLEYVEK